jgi:hypothetical protein
MRNRRKAIAAGIGGAALLTVLFLGVHYRELLWPHAAQQASNPRPLKDSNGLNIPTIDEMCKAAGATSANLTDCRDQENSAAEFVIAWMNLNGFIANGTIDLQQIQLAASLADSEGNGLSNDPGLGANSDSPDGLAPDTDAEPNIDPATGLPVTEIFNSPAQIAMFCMSSSNDWLAMYECISRYDPSSHLDGN